MAADRKISSPKGLISIKSRAPTEVEFRCEQTGPKTWTFFGPDIGQEVDRNIKFWRQIAEARIESKSTPKQTDVLDRTECAKRMLTKLVAIESLIRSDGLLVALHYALLLAYDVHALTVVSNEGAIYGENERASKRRQSNNQRAAERLRKKALYQAEAKNLRAKNPALKSNAAVARLIAKKHPGGNPDTIRKAIGKE